MGYNGYEWGCYEESVNGADGQAIGTGYQNTLDIVNQGCTSRNGGITAAQAALDAEINGYSDWYLPSRDELKEMYNTIGKGGPEGNIGGFETSDWPFIGLPRRSNNSQRVATSISVMVARATATVRAIRAGFGLFALFNDLPI